MKNAENWADLSQCILWEMEVLWATADNSHKKKKKEDPKDSGDVITETGKRLKWVTYTPLCTFHPKSDLHQQQKSVVFGSLSTLSKKSNTCTLQSPFHIQL